MKHHDGFSPDYSQFEGPKYDYWKKDSNSNALGYSDNVIDMARAKSKLEQIEQERKIASGAIRMFYPVAPERPAANVISLDDYRSKRS